MTTTRVITEDEARQRSIYATDWVPCKAAFIDCKTPGSDLKDNYSYVGVGVSQSSEQHVNLSIPHGYQLGAAGMPQGVSNSLHLHFTAEVFINFEGEFRLRWGPTGEQGSYVSRDGDVISVPTWIFRGFTNIGPDDGILYTTLGRDDTGGIIWGPQVIAEAENHGLYLSRTSQLIDTTAGEPVPAPEERILPLPEQLQHSLDTFTVEQFRTRVVHREDRVYSELPFLCSALPGGGARLAMVIGYGLSEDKRQVPNIHEPHGFCAAWLNAAEGQGMLAHHLDVPQTLTIKSGTWEVLLNTGAEQVTVSLGPRDAVSIPEGVVRQLRCVEAPESGEGEVYVVIAGESRSTIYWAPEVIAAAEEAGYTIDPNGYVCPVSYLVAAGLRAQ